MSEHVHEWCWTTKDNVEEITYEHYVIKCKHCPEMRRFHEAIAMFNEYGTLKAALSVAMNENQRLTKIVEDYEAKEK